MDNIAIIGKGVTLGYGKSNKGRVILENLNFRLKKGEMTCLLGANGVGKSTLIKAILGLLKPWKGEIQILGERVETLSPRQLANKLSVVLTDPFLSGNMTVKQLVALGRIPHTDWYGKLRDKDFEAISKALKLTKIQDLEDERLSEISDGQRQKAMIARALAQDGEIMILDEPTAHLDLVNRFEIMNLLSKIAKEQNKALLVVTHNLEMALDTSHQFWILQNSNTLVTGTPEDLIMNSEINHLFPSDKFIFNRQKGKLENRSEKIEYAIKGPEELVFWVEKALQKASITKLPSEVSVTENPFQIRMDQSEFTQIETFIQHLQKSNLP